MEATAYRRADSFSVNAKLPSDYHAIRRESKTDGVRAIYGMPPPSQSGRYGRK